MTSIHLFPRSTLAAIARSEPSLNAYSPLAQFSAQTLQEHAETLERLRAQEQAIVAAAAQLAAQETDDQRRYARAVDALAREEADLHALVAANRARTAELQAASDAEVLRRKEAAGLAVTALRELDEEALALAALEDELVLMRRGIEEKVRATCEQRRCFAQEFEHGMGVLERDRHDARSWAVHTSHRVATSPLRVREAVAGHSAVRAPHPPLPEPRSVSPTLRGALRPAAVAAAAVAAAAGGTVSPQRGALSTNRSDYLVTTPLPPTLHATAGGPKKTVSDFLASQRGALDATTAGSSSASGPFVASLRSSAAAADAIVVAAAASGEPARPLSPTRPGKTHQRLASAVLRPDNAELQRNAHLAGQPQSPESGGEARHLQRVAAHANRAAAGAASLHDACAATPQNVDRITAILRANQDAVNELDALGNTPLHTACAAHGATVAAVQSLLLAGSAASSYNEAGLTPFHLACLNLSDAGDHALKRFLIYSAARTPNERTARGETAAHLLATDDAHVESLRFLVKAGVDLHITALCRDGSGASRPMTALDCARAAGPRAAECRRFLESQV